MERVKCPYSHISPPSPLSVVPACLLYIYINIAMVVYKEINIKKKYEKIEIWSWAWERENILCVMLTMMMAYIKKCVQIFMIIFLTWSFMWGREMKAKKIRRERTRWDLGFYLVCIARESEIPSQQQHQQQ